MSPDAWKQSVGLHHYQEQEQEDGNSAFLLLPSPAFQNDLDDFMRGLDTVYPSTPIFGAIASTVSSLSRARLFRYEAGMDTSAGTGTDGNTDSIQTLLADGCIGVAMTGDLQVQTMIAQGAKPVGGVYKIVKGQDATIQTIALDEQATDLVRLFEEQSPSLMDEEQEPEEATDLKSKMAQDYQKARIPKPVLAEANFVMRDLSDDDQAFMRKTILVGIERPGSIARTPNELARLAEGRGHRFSVHQVASANMKEGAVTLSLGSVDIEPGSRMRFYVRESAFAKKEVEALWMGYNKRNVQQGTPSFTPTGCFLFPALDRGTKFFLGKPGFESGAASQYLPTVPCISGFFCNGVIGEMRTDPESGVKESASVHGSASGYTIFGSSKFICAGNIYAISKQRR
jgi:small ligand-binding sensory domain FIST